MVFQGEFCEVDLNLYKAEVPLEIFKSELKVTV